MGSSPSLASAVRLNSSRISTISFSARATCPFTTFSKVSKVRIRATAASVAPGFTTSASARNSSSA